MGRWAQRTRGGGGVTPLNLIVYVKQTGDFTQAITYQRPISRAALNPTAFQSQPTGELSTGLVQDSPRQVTATFDVETIGDVTLTYTGTTPGVLTPQTVPIH